MTATRSLLRPPSATSGPIEFDGEAMLAPSRPGEDEDEERSEQSAAPRPPRSKPPEWLAKTSSWGAVPSSPETPSVPEQPPSSPAEFEVVSELGRGSWGSRSVVARRKGCGEHALIAVKIIDASKVPGEETTTTSAEEKKLVHPFLARSLWRLEASPLLFAATELYAVSLADLAKAVSPRGAFADDEALFFASEIVVGLGYLHSRGVAHRALKPSNVLVDRRGHVALHDVLGNFNEFITAQMLPYLAPEKLTDATLSEERADWWSFGALAYFLLAGDTPFYDVEPRQHFANILHRPPHFRSPKYLAAFSNSDPSPASATLAALLAKDPKRRLAGLADVKHSPWFRNVKWNDVLLKLLSPPHTPHFLLYDDRATLAAGDLTPTATPPRTPPRTPPTLGRRPPRTPPSLQKGGTSPRLVASSPLPSLSTFFFDSSPPPQFSSSDDASAARSTASSSSSSSTKQTT